MKSELGNIIKLKKQNDTPLFAAFDFDNTMIDGDINDAVFAMMINADCKIAYSFDDYINDVEALGLKEAYIKMAAKFAGLSYKNLEYFTEKTLETKESTISIHCKLREYTVPIPKPNAFIMNLVSFLKQNGVIVCIVSATHSVIVKKAAELLFNIDKNYVFGMDCEYEFIDNQIILTDRITEPYTCFEGKVDRLKSIFGSVKPILTAGDSFSDVPLLNYTAENGYALVLGSKKQEIAKQVDKSVVFPV